MACFKYRGALLNHRITASCAGYCINVKRYGTSVFFCDNKQLSVNLLKQVSLYIFECKSGSNHLPADVYGYETKSSSTNLFNGRSVKTWDAWFEEFTFKEASLYVFGLIKLSCVVIMKNSNQTDWLAPMCARNSFPSIFASCQGRWTQSLLILYIF